MSYTLVNDDLIQRLERDKKDRENWLFLESHPDFVGQWIVESLEPGYMFDLEEVIGPYRAVSPFGLQDFMGEVIERGYKVAFFEDPTTILDAYEGLNKDPDVVLASDFEGTVNGLLPYQIQGYNFLKDLDAGVAMWSTGTGKTVLASALLKHHVAKGSFDTAFVVVKAHNRVNTQRSLSRLADLDSVLAKGWWPKERRFDFYSDVADEQGQILVTNYEKFRVDQDAILPLFDDRRILIIWDEMPTKLKTRTSQLYKAVSECLYTMPAPKVRSDKVRPRSLRQYMLSATPIENDPQDWFNCVRLMDPDIYGTVKDFETEYVQSYNWFDPNKPETWHKLDKMGLKTAHITHQVDKEDPDIAAQFPDVIEEPFYIEWNHSHRKLYDALQKEAEKLLDMEEDEQLPTFAVISVLQMLCCAPEMVGNSAAIYKAFEEEYESWAEENEFGEGPKKRGSALAARVIDAIDTKITNDGHEKIRVLEELVCDTHRDEKIVIFTSFNQTLMPILEDLLTKWGVKYVRYDGTDKQKQAAEDAFRDDPEIRVFLSSDKGSDSINLEAGSVVIHYDLPWKWSTKIQRQNRIHRVSSEFDKVRFYTLMMVDSVEERREAVIGRKEGFHQGVFKGVIADQSASARMTKDDLRYILTGRR